MKGEGRIYRTDTEQGLKDLAVVVKRCGINLGYQRRKFIAVASQLGKPVKIFTHEDPLEAKRAEAQARKRKAKAKGKRNQQKKSRRANR